MIAPCGTFEYSVVVKQDTSTPQRWVGQARSLRDSSTHPGMAGKGPLFELDDRRITLRATESKFTGRTNRHFRRWGPPRTSVLFEVGNAPAAVMQEGDQLFFHRHGTGDYALTIIRNQSLILGVGSIVRLSLGKEIQVEEDARVKELRLYELAGDLDRLDDLESQVVWLEIGQGDLDRQLELLRRAPVCDHLIVAIKRIGGEQEEPHDFWERVMDCTEAGIVAYYEVDSRFSEKQAWIDFVMGLPRERPNDLHLSFATGQERTNLCEGEEAYIGSYYARVERVYRRGIPGKLSSLGIGLLSSALTKDMIIESARLFVNLKWSSPRISE